MKDCPTIRKGQCLFTHLSVDLEDREMLAQRKIEAIRITYAPSEDDFFEIGTVSHFPFPLRECEIVDHVTKFFREFEKLRKHFAIYVGLQL